MRKLFVLLILAFLPLVASAIVEIEGIYYVLYSDSKTATVKSNPNKYSGNIVIPETVVYEGVTYNVTEIGISAFSGCSEVTSVTIPVGVTIIGTSAFEQCTGLTSITIPKNVYSLGTRVFSGCTGLTSIIVEGSITSKGSDIFMKCTNIKEITYDCEIVASLGINTIENATIKDGAKKIESNVFEGCSGLTSIIIPNSVTSIGNWAFAQCSGLSSITIPGDVTYIGSYAFAGCSGIGSVTIPRSVVTIGKYAFGNCPNLTTVTIECSPTNYETPIFDYDGNIKNVIFDCEIVTSLFMGVETIEKVSFINGVKEIDEIALSLCKGLTSVTIPSSVTAIGDDAFSGCSNLTSVTIGNGVTSIGKDAFYECSSLTSVTIGESVASIGVSAFYKCSSLTSVTIPNSVTSIGNSAFQGCSGMTEVVIGENVTSIGQAAFSGCKGLKSVTIPDGVTSIINSTFSGCSGLTSVSIPNSVTSIGLGVFAGCSGLSSVIIPSSVTSIIGMAFENCTGLSDVFCLAPGVPQTDAKAFYNVALSEVTLHVPAASLKKYEAANVWKSFKSIVAISDAEKVINVATAGTLSTLISDAEKYQIEELTLTGNLNGTDFRLIREMAGNDYLGQPTNGVLKKLDISGATIVEGGEKYLDTDKVTFSTGAYTQIGGDFFHFGTQNNVIGKAMFAGCDKLEEIVLPKSLVAIDEYVFWYCLNLKALTIQENVSSIGWGFVFGPNQLTSITVAEGNQTFSAPANCNVLMEGTNLRFACANPVIPEGTTAIGNYAFAWSNIKSISLPSTLKRIDNCAFELTLLESITIPASVEFIGERILNHCSNLKDVYSFIEEPYDVSASAFSEIGVATGYMPTLHVPYGTKDAYLNAEGWKEFKDNIVEMVMTNEVVYALNDEEKTVTMEGSDQNAKEVEIQSEVEIEGEKYVVTAIGDGAFENNKNLEKVSIPETIEFIGDNAFAGCTNLKEIRVLAEEPIKLGSSEAGTRGSGASSVFAEVDMETCVLYVPAGSKEKYEEADGWKEFKNIVEMGESVAITIGGKGKATFTGTKSLDFSFSDEVKAYVATGIDKESGTIWLTRVKDVPAGVPVMIKGEANKTYNVPVKESKDSYYKNMFVGNTSGETITINETSDDGTKTNYYMSGGQFVSVNGNAKIGDGKCYLQLPTTLPAAAPGANQPVTIAGTGKSSYAAPVDLNFTNVEGLKAFTATGYDRSSKTIWLTRVMKAQKGEGLLLKGDANQTYNIPSSGVQSGYGNMFVGNTSGETITIYETNDDGSLTNFYLSKGQFVSVNGNANIGNNKCYLQLPTEMVSAGASTRGAEANYIFEEPEVISMPIVIKSLTDADGTTGIDEVIKYDRQSDDAFYNLQGQRIDNPGKGLYIRNGKKVVIK